MSKETKFKYFLDGKEVTKEAIDWNRSMSIKPPAKNGNEVHITYMDYLNKEDFMTPSCGHSTRHKACGTYPVIKIDKSKIQNILREFEFFDNATWASTPKIEKVDPQKGIAAYATQEERDIDKFVKFTERTSSADELLRKTTPKIDYEAFNKEHDEHVRILGVKHNKHKAPLDIVQTRQFPKALQFLALATAFGNKKYEATDKDYLNFKRVAGGSQTYFDAAARHNTERNEIDEETGLPHMIHAVWNMLAGLEMYIEEQKLDVKNFSKEYLENLHKSK